MELANWSLRWLVFYMTPKLGIFLYLLHTDCLFFEFQIHRIIPRSFFGLVCFLFYKVDSLESQYIACAGILADRLLAFFDHRVLIIASVVR